MRCVLPIVLAFWSVLPAWAEESIAVPSGQPVTFHDVIWGEPGPAGLTARFRFIAPGIARDSGSVGFETAEADMRFLCESYALPRTEAMAPRPGQIVISLSDRPVEFGRATPEATQFFEAYSAEDGKCIWEGY